MMDDFFLRKAKKEDSTDVHDLVIEGKINPTGLKWERFIVAVTEDGKVIGCGQIKPHRDGTQELASIATTNSWRRKGVAKAIIEDLISIFEGKLHLMCQSSLGEMYMKFGFAAVSKDKMPKYFRRVSKLAGFMEPLIMKGETLLVMARDCP